MVMIESDEIPVCGSCGHRHVLGIKCNICGHVGKSQIFTKMKLRANEKRGFRVVICAGASMTSEESTFEVIEVCRRVICAENGINPDHEFNLSEEGLSLHALAYVGDLPVGIVRFTSQESPDTLLLRVDRFAVLREYQQSGLGYRMLHSILQKVSTTKPLMLIVAVPCTGWIHEKLVSFGFAKASLETNDNGYEQWQCIFGTDGSRSFKAFLTFLSEKSKATVI